MADEIGKDDPLNNESKESKFLGFALYSYNANRPSCADVAQENNETSDSDEANANADTSVSDFLRKEATSNHDFSLSVLTSNLSGEQETELRTFIAKRLARGTVYSGSGNITQLDAGTVTPCTSQCYYCLLRGEKEDDWIDEPRDSSNDECSYLSKDYVVCFVCSGENGLELFQDELDDYSTNLLPHLEKSSEFLDMQAEFRFLESWYEDNAQFLCRCTEYFKEDVSVLIHCGLVGTRLNVTSSDLRIQKDIKMFVEACSIVKLLNSLSDSNQLVPKTQMKRAGCTVPKAMSVKIDGSSYGFSSAVTTQFCREWSKTMLSGNTNSAVFLRQVIENYKLKVIQDMNTLKRLFRHAETDHYALYRSYIFLVRCGNGPVLLRNTKLEALTLNSTDTLNIIKALEDYIEETGIFDMQSSASESLS